MKVEIQSPFLDGFLYMITAPFIWAFMPFKWFWLTARTLFQTGRFLGPLILVSFIWQLFSDFEYSLNILPIKEHAAFMRSKIIQRITVATILYFLVCIALKNSRKTVKHAKDYFTPEKMHPGSPLLTQYLKPKFQVAVYGLIEGNWIKSGQAFLTKDILITAYHVVQGYEQIKIVGPSNSVQISASVFNNVEGDVAMANMTEATAQYLGITSAKLVDSEPSLNSGLFVSAVGFEHATMGLLKPNPSFGFVTYEGSTIAGFSGAAYHNCQNVYGLHLGGSTQNLGYSSAYLSMLIRNMREDSEDYLVAQAGKYRKFYHQRSPFNPDEFRVRINGKYYLTDNEGLGRMLGVAQGLGFNDRPVDYEPECATTSEVVEREACQAPTVGSPSTSFDPHTTYNPFITTDVAPTYPVTAEQTAAFLGQRVAPVTGARGPTKAVTAVQQPKVLPQLATISASQEKPSDGRKQIVVLANEVSSGITKLSKIVKQTNIQLTPLKSSQQSQPLNEKLVLAQLTSLRQKIEFITQELGSIEQLMT